VQEVAFVVVHVSVTVSPCATVAALAVNVSVGAGVGNSEGPSLPPPPQAATNIEHRTIACARELLRSRQIRVATEVLLLFLT